MIHIKLEINDGMDDKAARFIKVLTDQTMKAVRLWHNDMLPGHFKLGAATKYGYKKRTEAYQKRKRRKGMLPALVWKGRARDRLTRPLFFKVSGSKGQATGRFIVGSDIRYFWMKPSGHPDKPKEMKATTRNEQETIRKFLEQAVPAEMEKTKKSRKRVIT